MWTRRCRERQASRREGRSRQDLSRFGIAAPFQRLGRHGGILRISRVGPMASDRPPPCTSCRSRPTHMTMSRLAGYSVSCPGGGSSYVTTRPLLCQGVGVRYAGPLNSRRPFARRRPGSRCTVTIRLIPGGDRSGRPSWAAAERLTSDPQVAEAARPASATTLPRRRSASTHCPRY